MLAVCLYGYLQLASRYGLVAIPEARSSHKHVTVKGAGIIIPLAYLFYFLIERDMSMVFTVALMMCAAIGFYDDMRGLGVWFRLFVQVTSIWLVIFYLIPEIPGIAFPLLIIIAVGSINVYNFMDGVNGMLVAYSIVTLLSLIWIDLEYQLQIFQFLFPSLIAVIVLGYWNFRTHARCFAGDVGSLSMGFIVTSCIMLVVHRTSNFSYAMLLSVYLIDGGITILQRLLRGENILQAHRFHLYEILANERGIPHLRIAVYFASFQIIINLYTLVVRPYLGVDGYSDLIVLSVILSLIYVLFKRKMLHKV